ncbi:MAG: DoxX family protein [Planctomycetia bacterium]|nr:DoxX family protein [Planctomycetia bacterium]
MSGFRIGLLGVIALVLLRISVGWHFVTQGMEKYRDADFSSRGYLSQAKGPFAEKFHELIPDYDGRERLSVDATKLRFERMLDGVKNQYGFNEKQMAEANQLIASATADVKDYLDSNKLEIDKYFQDLKQNTERRHSKDFQETPFAQKWVWDKQQELQTTVKPWTAWVDDRANELLASLNEIQGTHMLSHPPYKEPPSDLEKADKLVLYSNLAIGVCLIIGLFTRFASFGGALFMLSLILAQPPLANLYPPAHPSAGAQWIVNKEVVEMMALFALAFLPTGRWGGLDFFIHHLITRPLFGRKEEA